MTQGTYDYPISFLATFKQLMEALDTKKHRLELYMSDGNRYWVKAITEEWEDAIRILPENDDKPVFLMKHTIQSLTPVKRPVEAK